MSNQLLFVFYSLLVPLHHFFPVHLDVLHTLSMHHSLSLIIVTSEMTSLLVLCGRLSSEESFPPKIWSIKKVALKHSQTFVIFSHSVRYFLKNVFVQISIGKKLALNHNFFLSLLGNFISFFEHVLDLISPLLNHILDLIILITFFAATHSPRRKYHVFQLLVLLDLLFQRTHFIIISVPPRERSFYFYSYHSAPSRANEGT